ncbi:MAG: hypothetical protein RLP02_34345 [Coleofasciculus sp. C2-GNP5-27]
MPAFSSVGLSLRWEENDGCKILNATPDQVSPNLTYLAQANNRVDDR